MPNKFYGCGSKTIWGVAADFGVEWQEKLGEVLFFWVAWQKMLEDGMAKYVGGWNGKILLGWGDLTFLGVACQNILDDGRQKNVAKLLRGV